MNRQLFSRVRMLLLVAVLAIPLSAQDVTVNVTQEGGLWDALEAQGITDFTTIKNLTVTGTMGNIDFQLIKTQMPNLESINIAGIDIKEIPNGTFASKEHLKTARLPEGITNISNNLFDNCQLLESVTFGSQTAVTGKIAFPASLRYVESSAFSNCQALTDLDFSACTSLERIGNSAFNSCQGLTRLDFSVCTSLRSMEGYAFANLYNLKEVILPSQGNLSLDYYCFRLENSYWDETTQQYIYKGLETLTLTKAVSYLGSNCLPRTLKTLFVESSTPPSCSGSFDYLFNNGSTSLKVYVPNGSQRNYAVADNWSTLYRNKYIQELGFKVNITGYGMVQKGNSSYGNGDAFFPTLGSATTLTAVPDMGNNLISVKLNDNDVNVTDGTFTIPAETTIGTLDVAFTTNPFTIDNPNGGELKDLIAASGRNANTISVLKVTGTMTAKDWTYVKNYMPALEEFDISETDVTTVPEDVLRDREKLTTVHLPATVTTIGSSAFYYCRNLTIVDGCENVKIIGSNAFGQCYKLAVFPFGNAIQRIDNNAFSDCSSLPTTLVLAASLSGFRDNIFNGSSVRSFDLSQCVMTEGISYNPFGQCTSLLLPEKGNYYLEWNALSDSKLTALRLPDAVTGMSGNVFPMTLERLYVSRTEPLYVENNTFNNVDFNSCTLYVPIGSTEAYQDARGWSDFTKVIETGIKVKISGYGSVQQGNITYGNDVVFFNNSNNATVLKAVPDDGCELISVKLNDNDLSVTDGTFTIPAETTVGTLEVAFTANPFTIDNPNGGELKNQIVAMGKNANSITVLKVTGKMNNKDWNYVKASLSMLRELDITQTDVKVIPDQVFQDHQNITNVYLPTTVVTISNSAFYNCRQLVKVEGCENVKEIGNSAFGYCDKLSNFPFGNALRSIGSDAFMNCTSLPEKLVMPASLNSLGWGNVFNGSSIMEFDLSQCTLTGSFAYNAFGKCTSLLLPEKGDYQLAYEALREAQLTELRLPAAISYMYGENVLPTTLERLYVSRPTPIEIGSDNTFNNIDLDRCVLYVPIGSIEAYTEASRWSNFGNVKEYGMQVTVGEQGKVRAGGQTLMGNSTFFPNGNAVTFEIIPNEGWHADAVTLDGTNIPFADNKFTLGSNQLSGKLAITFAVNQFTLQLQIAGSGKVKLGTLEYTANQTLTVDNLSTLNFTLEPAEGQVVSSITFNGEESVVQNGGKNYVTPAITANSTLAITFGAAGDLGDIAVYTVTTGEGGSIEYKNTTLMPETTINLPKGQDAVFAMKPEQYYMVDVVKLNGENVTNQLDADGKLTVKNVTDAAKLEVTFRINADIAVEMEDGGTLTNMLSEKQKAMVTKLTIKGQMWESDFRAMRDEMPLLKEIDLWEAKTEYIPYQAFCTSSDWNNPVGKKSLTSVRLPKNTHRIGGYAFAGCSNLRKVNFEELTQLEWLEGRTFALTDLSVIDLSKTQLIELGSEFYQVKNLENIKLPKTLTRLGDAFSQTTLSEIDLSECTNLKTLEGTFSNCKSLVKVILPEGLTSISGNAFSNCEALTTINFPKSLQSISGWTFNNTKLEKVDLSELTELQSIGNYAFYDCQELTEVLFPSSLEKMENNAFYNCQKLTSVDLSKTQLKNIPNEAFSNCGSLESVQMPKTLETIGRYAFAWNNKLGGVLELASTVTSIGEYAFSGTQISVVRSEATVPPTLSNNSLPDAWVAAFVPEGYAETYRAAAVWEDKVILDKEVHADVTVSKEGNLAIDINEQAGIAPALVTHLKVHGPLGAQDFTIMRENMTVLYDLDMSDAKVSVIPENAFNNVKKKVMMNVILPASLLRIEKNAFYGCSGLNGSLVLPEGVKFIGWGAFRGCTSLDEVVLNENLQVIQAYAFEGCSSLTQEITLPRNFESLGECAFANCSSLYGTVKFNRDFYMFMGTEGYGSSAGNCFANCSKIETVDMSDPDFLDEIPYGTFSGCTSLKTVLLPPMLDRIDDYAFSGCTSLDNIAFPNKLKVINHGAFQDCRSLSSVNLSDCKILGTIEGYAFYGCSNLETVYLPKSLNWINDYAFADCRKLANLTVEALQPADLGSYVFRHVHTDRCVLSIPTGTFYDYLSAAQWGEFVSMRKNIDVTVGEGANLYFWNDESGSANAPRRAGSAGQNQQGAKVKDGSSLYVQENEKAIFTVSPEENVVIAKVLFNGQDVTDQMMNGTYQTPGVTDASSFEVQVNVVGDIHVKELRMLDADVAVKVGENRQLRYAVYPSNATNKSIAWTSSDESVAQVNSEGIVTGMAPGRVEITGKTVDGDFEEKCEIVVMSNNYWIVMDNTVENYVENEIRLPLALHNEGEARDIQFDIYMPEGVNMKDWYGNFDIQLSARSNGHQVAAARTSDGAVRVIVYSQNGNQFQDSDGELLTLPFTTGTEVGDFDVTIKNIHVSGPDNFDFAAPNHTIHFTLNDYPLGDSNGDGSVTTNDIVYTVEHILEHNLARFMQRSADVNKDNQITVADVTGTVDIVLERPSNRAASSNNYDAQGRLYMSDQRMIVGEQQTIGLQIENAAEFIAFQCDVYLPAGMTIARDENDGLMIGLSGDVNSNHIISANLLENGVVRMVVMSPQNEAIDLADNNIVNLTVMTDDAMIDGSMIDIRDIRLVRGNNSEYLAPDASASVYFGDPTGISNTLAYKELKIRIEGHDIIVGAPSDTVLRLTSVNGISKNLQVHAGENRFHVETSGVYVINGKKFVIK